MANGIVGYDTLAMITSNEHALSEIIPNASQYFAFVRRKVKLTSLGLHILESTKGNQFTRTGHDYPTQFPETDPRHPSTIS